MNNLLERLHASYFFYILTSVRSFVKFGGYLASMILISVAMMFYGLRLWVVAGWEQAPIDGSMDTKKHGKGKEGHVAPQKVWRRRDRPVLLTLQIMLGTHFAGWTVFRALSSFWFALLLRVS